MLGKPSTIELHSQPKLFLLLIVKEVLTNPYRMTLNLLRILDCASGPAFVIYKIWIELGLDFFSLQAMFV